MREEKDINQSISQGDSEKFNSKIGKM